MRAYICIIVTFVAFLTIGKAELCLFGASCIYKIFTISRAEASTDTLPPNLIMQIQKQFVGRILGVSLNSKCREYNDAIVIDGKNVSTHGNISIFFRGKQITST